MAVALSELVGGGRAAVVTMELQRGVAGDLASFPELAAAVDAAGVVPSTARLLAAARARQVPVVHCTAEFRPDRRGSPSNAPLLAAVARRPGHLLQGSPAAQLIPGLGPRPEDLVVARLHGVAPFVGTTLDPTLRALGVSTVVVAGVSLNLGIVGLAVEAVDFGYQVVVAADAVAGVPPGYAEQVLASTISLVATVADVDTICAAF